MTPNQFRLVDGTIVKLCPTNKPLYCSKAGKFYSVHGMIITDEGCIMREIKPNFSPAMRTPGRHCHNGRRGCVYPIMRRYDKQLCHKLMALTWLGPRPIVVTPEGDAIPMQIDHLNGNILDWRADNLQYVTPEENRKRAGLLRVLRNIGRDPQQMSREELLAVFNHYEFAPKGEGLCNV